MKTPHQIGRASRNLRSEQALQSGVRETSQTKSDPRIGQVKWFGGRNKSTGRENDFGFIASQSGELYFQRSDVLSPLNGIVEGVEVAFVVVDGAKGPAAKLVQVLSMMSDELLVKLIKGNSRIPPEEVITVAPFMRSVDSVQDEIVKALIAIRAGVEHAKNCENSSGQKAPKILASSYPKSLPISRFWSRFHPKCPSDPFFEFAPLEIKQKYYESHFSNFRRSLGGLFSSVKSVVTTRRSALVYGALDQRDNLISTAWSGGNDLKKPIAEAVMAKMLSARAAEKASKWFYESVGATVEDISILQLERNAQDWITHDLLVDSSMPVDVKNARRPVSGGNFYVEHTIPKFKVDRQSAHVQIAGILSPYLSHKYIKNPASAQFKIDDIIFLGQTSQNQISQLIEKFNSPEFEVVRLNERVFPNWVFAYPKAWYGSLLEGVRYLSEDCVWPNGDEWQYVLKEAELISSIPALCIAKKELPTIIKSRLPSWQVDFYSRLQSLIGDYPEMPVIFFAVLTNFLTNLKDETRDFSPSEYESLLFPPDARLINFSSGKRQFYPLGAIDPLGQVANLIKTLSILWKSRGRTNLKRFSNFRFSGLGILQGRERNSQVWETIVAYCGGTAYEMDEGGSIHLTPEGKPKKEKGKCGFAPLIVDNDVTCQFCRKLICKECGFCSQSCQDRRFAEQKIKSNSTGLKAGMSSPASPKKIEPPDWDDIPIDYYEDIFRGH